MKTSNDYSDYFAIGSIIVSVVFIVYVVGVTILSDDLNRSITSSEKCNLPTGYTLIKSPEGKFSLKHPSFGYGYSTGSWDNANDVKCYAHSWIESNETLDKSEWEEVNYEDAE